MVSREWKSGAGRGARGEVTIWEWEKHIKEIKGIYGSSWKVTYSSSHSTRAVIGGLLKRGSFFASQSVARALHPHDLQWLLRVLLCLHVATIVQPPFLQWSWLVGREFKLSPSVSSCFISSSQNGREWAVLLNTECFATELALVEYNRLQHPVNLLR